MFKNEQIRKFFNHSAAGEARLLQDDIAFNLNRMQVTANQGLAGQGVCEGKIVGAIPMKGINAPVIRFSFPNGAKITACDMGPNRGCIVSVYSANGPVPRDTVEPVAYDLNKRVPGEYLSSVLPEDTHGAYRYNQRRFTFQTWEREKLGRFMAQFAIQQREAAPQQQAAPAAQPVAQPA